MYLMSSLIMTIAAQIFSRLLICTLRLLVRHLEARRRCKLLDLLLVSRRGYVDEKESRVLGVIIGSGNRLFRFCVIYLVSFTFIAVLLISVIPLNLICRINFAYSFVL